MSRYLFCLALFNLAVATGSVLAVGPAQAAEKGWILEQNKMSVRSKLYISAIGIKCGPDPFDASYVSKGPDWKLYIYNPKKRIYFGQSLESFGATEKVLTGSLSTMRHAGEYFKGKETTIAGLAAVQYRKFRGGEWNQVYIAKDIVLSPRLNKVASYILGTPPGVHDTNRIMLRREIIDSNGFRLTILNTTSARRSELPSSTFEPPPGYRLAEGLEQVVSR
jgi:hypothetical protein